ncbi:RNA polymerase sigma factor [Rhabdobacter roseus]|uniref:RNA polymerase sigma-70 factor (ECF subfamily) n=1 Tax=Rhabdobacter roseus TaxID=1655419 RepID=A0A840TIV7_9BACT|nr:sigma-70 family RNA polymerase sigma factor [Rhabdobacter roseus]MBB5283301.1 RNA polymerase sigma-70 factor (ECF subfamily) [Rhabdobacter roseus]
MPRAELLPHLFRTEFRKIVSVLGRRLGLDHLQAAEDIASDTFLLAYESWPYQGLPENPTAWLYAVAQNKAKNYLRRQQLFNQKMAPHLAQSTPEAQEPELDLSEKNIRDSQLRMLFALCHPSLPAEAQVGLALRILCGFGIEEIADAFLTHKETINKRLYRAREKLRQQHFTPEVPSETEMSQRLASVLTTLYLLFSEGYYSESHNLVLREDLCLEAMRLTYLLIEHEPTNRPPVQALLALMCFHASRFAARKNGIGDLILYQDQDETRWNQELIAKGTYYLHQAARGSTLSKYHLEATIAYWHTIKVDTPEKWEAILQLYNQLLILEYSPVAALNRTFALAKVHGNEKAIPEAEKLHLIDNQYYYVLLGELYQKMDVEQSRRYFQKALALAKTPHDQHTIKHRLAAL